MVSLLVGEKVQLTPVPRLFTVDMLTTSVAGEPVGMIKNTLTRMKQVHYPHTTWLCDEGNDPELRDFCTVWISGTLPGLINPTQRPETSIMH